MTRRHIRSLPFAASDERTTITDRDPLRATVRVGYKNDTLRVCPDEEPSVIGAIRID